MKKRILSMIIVCSMLVSLVPMSAIQVDAQETAPQGIILDAGSLQGGQEDSLYIGSFPQSEATPVTLPETTPEEGASYTDTDGTKYTYMGGKYYKHEPIKWQVLNNDTANDSILLTTEKILDVQQYHSVVEEVTKYNASVCQWFKTTLKLGFSTLAFGALDGGVWESLYGTSGSQPFWELSETDLTTTNFADGNYTAGSTDYAAAKFAEENSGAYWLHAETTTGGMAPYVTAEGTTGSAQVTNAYGLRPSVKLNTDTSKADKAVYGEDYPTSSVLFLSAPDGKVSNGVGGDCLTAVEAYEGSDWRVTFLDPAVSSSSTSDFSTGLRIMDQNNDNITSFMAEPGKKIKFTYLRWGSQTYRTDEYISVMIVDSEGVVLYYGNIAQMNNNGDLNADVELTIPADLLEGDYTLKFFNERRTPGAVSDRASKFNDIPLTVKEDIKYDITLDPMPHAETLVSANTNSAGDGETVTLTGLPSDAYHLSYWEVVNQIDETQTTSAKTYDENGVCTVTFTMPAEPVTATPTYVEHTYTWGTPDSEGNLTGSCSVCGYELTTQKRAVGLGVSPLTGPVDTNADPELYDYAPTSYVYYGEYEYLGHAEFDKPVIWQVQSLNNIVDDESGILLMSKHILDCNDDALKSGEWKDGNTLVTCNKIEENAFTEKELAAIQKITYEDDFGSSHTIDLFGRTWGKTYLNADQVFVLSVPEFHKFVANYQESDNSPASSHDGYDKGRGHLSWILRSPEGSDTPNDDGKYVDNYWMGELKCYSISAYETTRKGEVGRSDIANGVVSALRPVINLDKSQVLFTFGTQDNSFASSAAGTLKAMPGYSQDEWGVALLDTSRNFGVTETELSGKTGGNITLNYTGANYGTGESIYAFITEPGEDEILYYGKIKDMSSATAGDGSATFTVPVDFPEGTYTMKVFSVYNEPRDQYAYNYPQRYTKYASAFDEVSFSVEEVKNYITEASVVGIEYPAHGASPTYVTRTNASKYTADEGSWFLYEDGVYTPMEADETFVGKKEYAVRVTFTAESGWDFADDCVYYVAGQVATVLEGGTSKERTLEVRFVVDPDPNAEYSVTILSSSGGTVTAESVTYKAGATVYLTPTPDEGMRAKEIIVTKGTVVIYKSWNETFYFTMPAEDVEVQPVFEIREKHTLTILTDGNGAVSELTQELYPDDTIELMALPKANMIFQRWRVISGDLELSELDSTNPQLYITMPNSDIVLKAYFVPAYQLSITCVGGGSVYDENYMQVVNYSAMKPALSDVELQLHMGLENNYDAALMFDYWEVVSGGVRLSLNEYGNWGFKMPSNDVELIAHFKKNPDILQVNFEIEGEGSVSGP